MANFNGKGPEEKGPKTGRGLGKCNKDFNEEEWLKKERDGKGYRMGRARGKGRGFGLNSGKGNGRGKGHGGNYSYDN
jgi:hypothetical protein